MAKSAQPRTILKQCRRKLQTDGLAKATETLIAALSGITMPEARLRAALDVVKLFGVADPEDVQTTKTIEVILGDEATLAHDSGTDGDNPKQG